MAYLSLDVKDTTATRARDLAYGHERRSIEIPREFCMLDEGTFVDEPDELFARNEVVVSAVDFTGTGKSRGVWWTRAAHFNR